MDRRDGLHGFQLDDDLSLDDQVRSECLVDLNRIANNRYRVLGHHEEPPTLELLPQDPLIDGLEQSRTDPPVNLVGCINNLPANSFSCIASDLSKTLADPSVCSA
jgi:hypothetical protein